MIAAELGRAILAGRHAIGSTLPGEVVSAVAFGVSRGAYREAVLALTAKGLLESRPKIGTTVLPRSRWNLLDRDVLTWALNDVRDRRLLRDLVELLGVVAPAAAAMAALRRSREDLQVLHEAVTEMRLAGAACARRSEHVRRFHVRILACSSNDAFVAVSAAVRPLVSCGWNNSPDRDGRRVEAAGHTALLKAILARDPDRAEDAMKLLLEYAGKALTDDGSGPITAERDRRRECTT